MYKKKKCVKCNIVKPETTEYFYRKRNGFDSRCKECMSIMSKKLYYKNIEKERERCRIRKRSQSEIQRDNSRKLARDWSKSHNGILKVYRRNAKIRELEFSISKADFQLLLDKDCYYCGNISKGVDRIDSLIGYTKDNCVSCCKKCNRMKVDMNKQDFIDQCILIASKFVPFPSIEILMEGN
jgi:hypothetical protein